MKKITYSLLILLLTVFSACNKFLDTNINPNFPDDTTPNNRLPSIITNANEAYAFTMISRNIGPGYFTQQLAAITTDNSIDRFFTGNAQGLVWQRSYFHSGGNIPFMIERATSEGSWHYVGAGKVMKAIIFGNLTDLYGDVPMSEAFQGGSNFNPKYDTQEQIYSQIHKLLDEAIEDFGKSSFRPLSAGDIMFNGDVNKWKKLAYALKARYTNHLTKKSTYNPDKVLEYVALAMTSNADDAHLIYTADRLDTSSPRGKTRNNLPATSTGSTISQHFISTLDGTYAQLNTGTRVVDPRLPIMTFQTPNEGNRFVGVVNGSSSGRPTRYGDFYMSWYGSDRGPVEFITYAEVKFIEAEAAFRKGDKTRALNAYTEGIKAHAGKIGVKFDDINTYLKSAAVAKTAQELTLRHIMTEKYIALFLNPEVWVDMRRFDYSSEIYTGLTYPERASSDFNGEWPHRLFYDNTEVMYNNAEVQRMGGGALDYPTKKLWFELP